MQCGYVALINGQQYICIREEHEEPEKEPSAYVLPQMQLDIPERDKHRFALRFPYR